MFRAFAAALVLLAPLAASAATLTIKVEDVDKKGGILRLSLYDEASWSNDASEPIASADVPAVAPQTIVTLTNLKPGIYGVKLYEDANSNGKFDKNFIGLPLERYGFSNDARPVLSAPGFDRTKFRVADGANEIAIHLQ
jgi:uncharacterized protein (DUF2141 family)